MSRPPAFAPRSNAAKIARLRHHFCHASARTVLAMVLLFALTPVVATVADPELLAWKL